MVNFCWRVDSHMFMRLFVAFNVVLAVYNFLSFRVSPVDRSIPCAQVLDPIQDRTLRLIQLSMNEPTAASTSAITGILKRGKYYVLPNYVKANRTYRGVESVTLTTQASAAFLKHAEVLCQRWGGPISIAVYAAGGGPELARVIQIIGHMRVCSNECIHQNVSWHFILEPDASWPDQQPVGNATASIPVTMKPGWNPPTWQDLSSDSYNCTEMAATVFKGKQKSYTESEQRKLGRGYPINVVRNVARSMATTLYILASDIELYTSVNIIPRFLRLVALESADAKAIQDNKVPHVYVLPIFEVHKDEDPPETKDKLVQLLDKKRAVYFHKWTCDACQNFPGRNTWATVLPGFDKLGIHTRTRRDKSRGSWEPIYIGTNADPFYEEELSWEGKRDKMSQMYEMCMMGYNMYILDNAFLVHAPGIKTINNTDEKRRAPFMRTNNAIYQSTMNRIRKKYSSGKHSC